MNLKKYDMDLKKIYRICKNYMDFLKMYENGILFDGIDLSKTSTYYIHILYYTYYILYTYYYAFIKFVQCNFQTVCPKLIKHSTNLYKILYSTILSDTMLLYSYSVPFKI